MTLPCSKEDILMESIINNPGLQHLAERIFLNLDTEHLKICRLINQSCKQILENPFFWLKKFKNLSKENQKDWIKILKEVKNSEKIHAIISYLQWNLKKEAVSAIAVDLQCYTSPAVQDNLRKMIMESCEKQESSAENTEIVKILAPLTDNPNLPDKNGVTPSSVTENAEIHRILETENAPGQHNAGPLEEPFNKRSKKSSVSMDTMTATGSTTSGWHSGGPSSCGRCASRRGYKKSE